MPITSDGRSITVNSYREAAFLYDSFAREFWPDLPSRIEPEYEELMELQSEFHAGFFDNQTDPNGNPWADLSPVTVAQKGHNTILERFLDLRESLANSSSGYAVREVQPDGYVFGTSVFYAAIHQYGTDPGTTPEIPARPHTGWSEEAVEVTVNQLADRVVLAAGGYFFKIA